MSKCFFYLFVFVFTSSNQSQDTSSFFPESIPLPTFLLNTAGEWKVINSLDPGEIVSFTWEKVLNERFMMGKGLTGDSTEILVILGYNKWDRKYFMFSADGASGDPSQISEGIYYDSVKTIVYTYKYHYPLEGDDAPLNMKFVDEDNILWEFLTPDGEKSHTITFTRLKNLK